MCSVLLRTLKAGVQSHPTAPGWHLLFRLHSAMQLAEDEEAQSDSSSDDGEGWLQRFDADDGARPAADVRDSIKLPGKSFADVMCYPHALILGNSSVCSLQSVCSSCSAGAHTDQPHAVPDAASEVYTYNATSESSLQISVRCSPILVRLHRPVDRQCSAAHIIECR